MTKEETTALWCVHIIGPDDVIAYPNRAAAEREARLINDAMAKHMASRAADPNWPALRAEVTAWPHSAAAHAADLARNIQQMECKGNG